MKRLVSMLATLIMVVGLAIAAPVAGAGAYSSEDNSAVISSAVTEVSEQGDSSIVPLMGQFSKSTDYTAIAIVAVVAVVVIIAIIVIISLIVKHFKKK